MHANRTIDVGVTLGQGFYRGGVIGANANAQEMADTTGAGGVQRGIQGATMGGKVEAIKVTVGVDEH